MKTIVTREFNLPEDQDEFDEYIQSGKALYVLHEFSNHLRKLNKYGQDGYDEETVSKIREIFYETVSERGIEL